jgi:hypothetical protein
MLGSPNLELKQAFVDVSDLLDVKRTEGKSATLPTNLHILHSAEQPQYCPVVDSRRKASSQLVGRATFEPGVAIRIEQSAAVGREPEIFVRNTVMQRSPDG